MRIQFGMNHIRTISVLALALFATSCSRSLPTAPASQGVRDDHADPFLTAGLENQVVVTLADGVNAQDVAAQYGAAIVKNDDGTTAALRPIAGQTAATLLNQLTLDGRIVTSEPNGWLAPAEVRQQSFAFDDGFGNHATYAEQPAAEAIHLPAVPGAAKGWGVKVAIIDTGADMTHPELKSSIVGGWDFVDNDPDPTDQKNLITGGTAIAYGHGTHVAGIVHLVAPEAQLLIVRVLNSDGRGDIVNVTAGVNWAVEHGAKVINLSLGTIRNAEALQHALEAAEAAGVIVVAAIGNSGSMLNLDFPGYSSHAFGIAAVDANGHPAPFSSFNKSEVLLSAPGVGVRSTYPGGGYMLWSGTSMSTPFVAGTAALLAQYHPSWTMDDMKMRLENGTTPVQATSTDLASQFGAGMLDVSRAVAPDFQGGDNSVPDPIILVRGRH